MLIYQLRSAIKLNLLKVKGANEQEQKQYQLFQSFYVGKMQLEDYHVSPICASTSELAFLPPAVITLAEKDILFSEGNEYVNHLQTAEVPVACRVAKGMPHGFFESSYSYQDEGAYLTDDIKKLIKNGKLDSEREKTVAFIEEYLNKWLMKKINEKNPSWLQDGFFCYEN